MITKTREKTETQAAKREKVTPFVSLQDAFIEINGLRLHYRVGGEATQEIPIVLIHGLGVSCRYWIPAQQLLARRHPVYALDLPGIGESDDGPKFKHLRELDDWLIQWITALNLTEINLIGHSLGSQIAIDIAANHPALVKRLVIASSTGGYEDRPALATAFGLCRDAFHESLSLWPIVLRDYLRAGPRYLYRAASAAQKHPTADMASRVTAPTLIVRALKDPTADANFNRDLATIIPHAQLIEFPGCQHAIQYDEPILFARIVEEFLARQDKSDEQLDLTSCSSPKLAALLTQSSREQTDR